MDDKKNLTHDYLTAKLNIYCVHRLLHENKRLGVSDKNIWSDLRDLFDSKDYGLFLELRDLKTIWGDTDKIDELLKNNAHKEEKSG